MNKFYRTVGIGLISLPLLVGCGKKEGVEQVQLEPITESKLEIMLSHFRSRFSYRQTTLSEYSDLIFEELKSQKLLAGDRYSGDNAIITSSMAELFQKKLSVKVSRGLNDWYITSDSTISGSPYLSDKAKEDIAAYEQIKTEVGQYLAQKVGKKPVSSEVFETLIQEYVILKHSNLGLGKAFDIARDLKDTYKKNFNVRFKK